MSVGFQTALLLLALDLIVVACTLHYAHFCLFRAPHSNTYAGEPYPFKGEPKIKRYLYFIVVFVGFFIAIDGTTQALFAWAPEFKEVLGRITGLIGSPFIFLGFFRLRKELDELEALRLEKVKGIHARWRKTEDAKNWVEMEDGKLVEVENLLWERFQGCKWKSCYEPPPSTSTSDQDPT